MTEPPVRKRRREGLPVRLVLGLIITGFLLLSSVFNLVTPLFEGFDENYHVDYVMHVERTGSIPVLPHSIFEAVQPPAYYYLQASVVRFLGLPDPPILEIRPLEDPQLQLFRHDQELKRGPLWNGAGTVRALRFVSALLGATTLVVVFLLVRQLFPTRADIALSTTAAVAFFPQFVSVHSLVNNDALAVLCAAVLLLASVRLVLATRRRELMQFGVLAGVAIGVGLITKGYILALIPVPFLGLALGRRSLRDMLIASVVVTLVATLLSGWMFVRNVSLYGDLLASRATREHLARLLPQMVVPRSIDDPVFRGAFLQELRSSFWYVGGGGLLRLQEAWYLALDIVSVVLVAGTIGAFANPWRIDIDRRQRRALAVLASSILLQFAGIVYYNLSYQQWQGRWMLPVIPGVALLLVLGFAFLLPERRRAVANVAIPAGLGGLTLFALLRVVVPAYHG